MIHHILFFFVLLGCWFVLSGFFSPLFVGFGVISCLISVYFFARIYEDDVVVKSPVFFFMHMMAYTVWLVREITVASLDTSLRIWQKHPDITPQMGWQAAMVKGEVRQALYANSITLTPGTVAIAIKKESVWVHALTKANMKALENGAMRARIVQLWGLD